MESPKKAQEPNNNNTKQNISFDEYYNQLPKDTRLGVEMVQHQGFWCLAHQLKSILSFQAHFKAQPTDLFITGMPKTGNTWLKSLIFATINRHHQPIFESPLLHHNPHDLIPTLEIGPYLVDPQPNLDNILKYPGPPRILSSHLGYECLPRSIHKSSCRIIYMFRNPLDAFVSLWFFTKGLVEKNYPGRVVLSMEELFELYLQGITPFGPFFEHVLGYWKKSVQVPDKVLFLKYEELLEHTTFHLKRIAEFVGHPFSPEEEQGGVIEEILKHCSIENLKELMVNKNGEYQSIDNRTFFRKGEAGDWSNYLTPSMVDRMRELMHQKFDDFGLLLQETGNQWQENQENFKCVD